MKKTFLFILIISLHLNQLIAQPVPPYAANVGIFPGLGNGGGITPSTPAFSLAKGFTIEGWIYIQDNNGGIIVTKNGTSDQDKYGSFFLNIGSGNISTPVVFSLAPTTGIPGQNYSLTSNDSISLKKWTHIAAVYTGNQMILYINGIFEGSMNVGAVCDEPSLPLSFYQPWNGTQHIGSAGYPVNGYLSYWRFWNIPRTQLQISSDIVIAAPIDNLGLVANWPMDEATGFTYRDITSNNNSLKFTNFSICSVAPAYFNGGGYYNLSYTQITDGSLNKLSNLFGILTDYSGDGYPDLLLTQVDFNYPSSEPSSFSSVRAFRNVNGNFQDFTNSDIGLIPMSLPRGYAIADFTGTGKQSIFFAGAGPDIPPWPGEKQKIFVPNNSGNLVDQSSILLPQENIYAHGCSVGDINGDGYTDIFLNDLSLPYPKPRFWINDGKGHFTDSYTRLPSDIANLNNASTGTPYTSSLIVDINGDGYPDLVLGSGNTNTVNEVLINDKSGNFQRNSKYVLPKKLFQSNSINPPVTVFITSADLNGDGKPDLILSTTAGYYTAGVQILLSQPDGSYKDTTLTSGIEFNNYEGWVTSIQALDVNGDGYTDLVMIVSTTFGGPSLPRLYLNKGDGTFVDASAVFGECLINNSLGSGQQVFVAGDINKDGLIDLITASPTQIRVATATKKLNIKDFVNPSSVIPSVPTITSQPTTVSVKSGSSATLSVTATGTGTIQYQWQKNGINIANAYSSSYTIPAAQLSDGGIYSVLVGNAGGTTVSNYVPLSVTATGTPTITTNPSSLTITSGSTVVFKAAASSTTTATYQWYLNGVAITGATSSTLLIPGATSANVGTYNCTITNSAGSVTTTSAQLTLLTTTNPGRLVNLSVLTMDGPGSQMLTLGFVNGGAGTTGSEPLLIRASGPALTAFNVPTVLADPALTLFQGSNVVVTNDNWGSSASNITAVNAAEAATGAFQLTPTTSLDAAVVQSLASVQGGYTVQVQGNNNGVGNAMAEVYDNTTNYTATSPRLVNLSCRQLVPANGTLTAGFVISGTTSKTVLIRASGPTLASYNVPGTMTDPQISVFSGATVIASNAGWAGDTAVATAAANVGAFPYASNTSKDSAVLMTLAPGSYTVQATSVSGTAGVTLIEVYEVP